MFYDEFFAIGKVLCAPYCDVEHGGQIRGMKGVTEVVAAGPRSQLGIVPRERTQLFECPTDDMFFHTFVIFLWSNGGCGQISAPD